MLIETKNSVYEVEFGQAQVEITALCNMDCLHCRNSFDRKSTLSADQIQKFLFFVLSHSNDLEFVISGGEPFLHPEIIKIFQILKKDGIEKLFITTNGSILKECHIPFIKQFKKPMVSISLDALDDKTHDDFRRCKGAFSKAVSAINLLVRNGIKTGIRLSVSPFLI